MLVKLTFESEDGKYVSKGYFSVSAIEKIHAKYIEFLRNNTDSGIAGGKEFITRLCWELSDLMDLRSIEKARELILDMMLEQQTKRGNDKSNAEDK